MEPELPDGYEYLIDHTPWGVAQFNDIELSLRESDDGRHTRRVIRSHSGVKDGERRLSVSLVHQKINPGTGRWEDESFDLRTLKNGEEVTLELDAEQTAKLIAHLGVLEKINDQLKTERGSVYGIHRAGEVFVPPQFEALIEQLRGTSADPEEVARNFAQLAPDLAEAAGIVQLHRVRSSALAVFREHLEALDWTEGQWQKFFEANDWIFGHGLNYKFLVTEQAQAHYGGGDVSGRGGEEGDFLMASDGDARFSVLVEIKKPDTDLIDAVRYRNGAWRPSKELAGGVAQLQANCDQWEFSSRLPPNAGWARERSITTADPEGILLIGRLSKLQGDEEKLTSFERFRRDLNNPKVITYDELYARAEFIVARTIAQDAPEPDAEPEHNWEDDLPF